MLRSFCGRYCIVHPMRLFNQFPRRVFCQPLCFFSVCPSGLELNAVTRLLYSSMRMKKGCTFFRQSDCVDSEILILGLRRFFGWLIAEMKR